MVNNMNNMKWLIKKLLQEAMVSFLNNWKNNLNCLDGTFNTLISKDDKTGDKLYLFVGFYSEDDKTWYSYSFMLLDKDDNPLTRFLVKRNDVNKYLPDDIKNKKLIFPIIENMTRKLLDSQLPNEIIRKTSEPLDGDSLKRYEIITNIMINEYGYKLIDKKKDSFGCTTWVLSKIANNDDNKNMLETYNLNHEYTAEEIAEKAFRKILPLLKNQNKS